MKYLLFISFLALAPLYAVQWSPSASLSVLWEGNAHARGIDSTGSVMSSIAASADISILEVAVSSHHLSFPIHAVYTSASAPEGRMERLSSIEVGAGIGYSYRIGRIEIGGAATAAMRWYEKADAGEWIVGGRLHAAFSILPCASLSVPLWILGGRSGITVRTGAGLMFRFGGAV